MPTRPPKTIQRNSRRGCPAGPSIRSEASWPISPSLLKNCRS
jgi:hypothetical protein